MTSAVIPTDEQQAILDEVSHCAVIASPGSGKTFTLAQKIRTILPTLPGHRGVAAISFTNKASEELRRRATSDGIDRKSSFFGTIDKFFIAEILIPFGRHVFGNPKKAVEIIASEEIPDPLRGRLASATKAGAARDEIISLLGELYVDGWATLRSVGALSCHIFQRSKACQRYLAARYSHVLIDEYQDCDKYQHSIFLELVAAGVVGVAVGDLNQSIFGFAGKDPMFLQKLVEDARFATYELSQNHRSNPAITHYALRLLSARHKIPKGLDDVVWEKNVDGSEQQIAEWIAGSLPAATARLSIESRNQIAILTSTRRTQGHICHALNVPHKNVIETSLDKSSTVWGRLFRDTLLWLFSEAENKYELIERYISIELKKKAAREVMGLLGRLERIRDVPGQLINQMAGFEAFARIVHPKDESTEATAMLQEVLENDELAASYAPPARDEVVVMTLHKAKGLAGC